MDLLVSMKKALQITIFPGKLNFHLFSSYENVRFFFFFEGLKMSEYGKMISYLAKKIHF